MTGYLIILLCVLGIIIEYQMQKKFGVLSLFCVLWIFIIVLAEMRLFGMVEVSEKVYFELLLGTGSFIIFFLCGRFGKDNNLNRKIRFRKVNDSAFVFNLPSIYAIEIVTLIGWAYVAIQCAAALATGLSLEQFHNIYLNRGAYSIFGSGLFELFIKRICVASVLMLTPLTIVMIFERKKEYWIAILLAFVCILLNQLSTGGRIALIYMFADILIALSIYKVSVPPKWKKRMLRIGTLLIIGVLLITVLRKRILQNGKWELLYENIYIYFSLCIPLSDYWLKWIDANHYLTLGVGAFSGIINLVNIFYARLIGTNLAAATTVVNVFTPIETQYITVFKEASCNAYVTWIFHLYADFREIGVVVGSVLYGYCCGRTTKNAYRKGNAYRIAFLLLLVQSIVKTFVRWEFSVEAYILAFVFLRVCFKRGRER